MKVRWLAVCAAMAVSVPSGSAFAQQPAVSDADKASARDLFFKGHDAYKAEDYAEAVRLFKQSDKLYPAPTALLWQGRSLAKAGKLVEAHERLRETISRELPPNPSKGFVNAVESARVEADELRARLPSVVISAQPAETITVMIDDTPVPTAAFGVSRFVDPGQHIVSGSAPGHVDRSETITLEEGKSVNVSLVLTPNPKATAKATANSTGSSGDTLQIAGFSLIGVGGAALLVSAVTGGLYLAESATVDDECNDDNECNQAGIDAVNARTTFAWVNTLSFFSGVALAGAGVAMVVVGDDDGSSEGGGQALRLAPYAGPTGAGLALSGRF